MVDGNIVIGKTRVLESILKLEEAHEGGIISPVDIYNELKGTTRIKKHFVHNLFIYIHVIIIRQTIYVYTNLLTITN